MKRRSWFALMVGLLGLLGVGAASSYVGAAPATPTFGAVPAEAKVQGSRTDLSKVPDYVSVLGKDGEIAGYVSKVDLFPSSGRAAKSPADALSRSADADTIPVYDISGRVIGQWVPRQGFVAR